MWLDECIVKLCSPAEAKTTCAACMMSLIRSIFLVSTATVVVAAASVGDESAFEARFESGTQSLQETVNPLVFTSKATIHLEYPYASSGVSAISDSIEAALFGDVRMLLSTCEVTSSAAAVGNSSIVLSLAGTAAELLRGSHTCSEIMRRFYLFFTFARKCTELPRAGGGIWSESEISALRAARAAGMSDAWCTRGGSNTTKAQQLANSVSMELAPEIASPAAAQYIETALKEHYPLAHAQVAASVFEMAAVSQNLVRFSDPGTPIPRIVRTMPAWSSPSAYSRFLAQFPQAAAFKHEAEIAHLPHFAMLVTLSASLAFFGGLIFTLLGVTSVFRALLHKWL